MGATKTEHFTEVQNELAILLKAMAHPARVAIIEHLLKTNACVCGDIVEVLPLAQATVSQHLKELKNAGLIQGTIEGTAVCYCIEPEAIGKLMNYFGQMNAELQNRKNNCC